MWRRWECVLPCSNRLLLWHEGCRLHHGSCWSLYMWRRPRTSASVLGLVFCICTDNLFTYKCTHLQFVVCAIGYLHTTLGSWTPVLTSLTCWQACSGPQVMHETPRTTSRTFFTHIPDFLEPLRLFWNWGSRNDRPHCTIANAHERICRPIALHNFTKGNKCFASKL